jgi:hypothetical protein
MCFFYNHVEKRLLYHRRLNFDIGVKVTCVGWIGLVSDTVHWRMLQKREKSSDFIEGNYFLIGLENIRF